MSKRILHKGKWLSFGEIDVTTASGKSLTWEFATREGTTGAVSIIAIKRGDPDSIILVKQFRPPIETEIIELPAGLIDPGCTREETALRELREETGYSGKVISEGPPVFNTPGMTDENVACLIVEVGAQNAQETEEHEEIEVIELPLNDLKSRLIKLEADGTCIDAKLWCLAEGMALGNLLSHQERSS